MNLGSMITLAPETKQASTETKPAVSATNPQKTASETPKEASSAEKPSVEISPEGTVKISGNLKVLEVNTQNGVSKAQKEAEVQLLKLATASDADKADLLQASLCELNLYDYAPWMLTKEACTVIKKARDAQADDRAFGLPATKRYPLHDVESCEASIKLAATHNSREELELVKSAAIESYQKLAMMEYEDQTTQKKKNIKDEDEDNGKKNNEKKDDKKK